MHKLNRDPVAPACLANYQYGRDRWGGGTPNPDEYDTIWEKLNQMQKHRCAYCEAAIDENNRHVEHFAARASYPQGTFLWRNLFGCCKRETSCGICKDSRQTAQYDWKELIKPDEDDPDDYFVFVKNGTITLRLGLAPAAERKARETLRVFNLDAEFGELRKMRRKQAMGYIASLEAIFADLADSPELLPLAQDEFHAMLAETAHLPFATAIRHALTSISTKHA